MEATPVLERSLRRIPGFVDAHNLLFLAMCHARLGETDKAKECYQRAKRRRAEISEKLPPAWAVELDEFQAEVNSCSTHGTRKGNDERRMTRPVKDPTAGRSSEDWMLQINIRQPKASR